MDTLAELAAAIGIIAGAIIGLGIIGKALLAVVKFIRSVVRAADSLEEMVPTLKEIALEFQPNGGLSLRDTVDRMDYNIHTNADNNLKIYEMLTQILEEAEVDNVNGAELDDLIPTPDYPEDRLRPYNG